MISLGAIVNVVCSVVGSVIGMVLTKIPERTKETIMQGVGLTVKLIGLQMALGTESIIIVLLSLLFGAMIGEFFQWESHLNKRGEWIASRFTNQSDDVNVAQAFVTASLLFVV